MTDLKCKVIVLMGVTGSGKSTVGQLLSRQLAWDYYDADDFHPPVNVKKMANGIPLEDEDRWPWLEGLATEIGTWLEGERGAILACSALKESYRSTRCWACTGLHRASKGGQRTDRRSPSRTGGPLYARQPTR